ncbi:unnamed protein product [Spirodela intermedia]|uniref:Fatty acid desaturase domain-containing protein n=1 Tax=Spirodela intermedia TaxID=51605 RepID=A0A7I8IBR2_SPIIN|nr:unnamed protein product [Spirodela intermedia]CAA2617457.1 unnamed protein product [Spirodela intermedia]CAA2632008.1 unnamed protein product [Spirodela intermedia]CAA6655175.1 unnamed protein product [Spirodela intermedia]CAA6657153.1 unnamed protein product [Spirodela intermedia]
MPNVDAGREVVQAELNMLDSGDGEACHDKHYPLSPVRQARDQERVPDPEQSDAQNLLLSVGHPFLGKQDLGALRKQERSSPESRRTQILLAQKRVPNRKQEILGVALFWVWYPLLVSCLPNWGERIMFVVASFSVTGIQHIQFCLNYFSSSVYVGHPGGNDWFEKQTMGTLNITCSPWMDWFHGGLQFQVEHHLFPRLPRCNLRKISPFVRELCKKHKLSYSTTSFWGAAALQARDLGNPVPRNLVWEAVNTHG